MKQKLKKCKGFQDSMDNPCLTCKRHLINEPECLIKEFVIDPDNGKKYCNHYISIYKLK